MTNADVARVFSRIATMLELDGANVFRVRAYREAARVVEALAEPVGRLAAAEGALEELPGIGRDLAGKIREILAGGSTGVYDQLLKKYPLPLVQLTELQGLGAKRVRQLHDALGIGDRASLEAAARAGKLRDLPGFGEKLEQKILHSLSIAEQVAGRMLLGTAWSVASGIVDLLRALPGVEKVEAAGSFRRRRETVGDLDILVCGGKPDTVMDAFVGQPGVAETLGRGDTKSSVRLANGLQVDLRLVPRESFGAALLYFTGSKEHNIELRKLALEQGTSLNEYGLTRERGGKVVAGRTEEEIYRALGLAWIPPELREAHGEIALARAGKLPKLIEQDDLAGDLHMHTTRSDGRNSLVEMVRAAKDRGYRYCAVTEHSKSLAMAGGFDEARVRKSVGEIAEVRRQVPGIDVLHGLEVDILADGALDLDDDALALLDWVIVSLHSRLDQPGDAATARVLKALEHPAVCAMGHPTGRMIGTRPGAAFDQDRVFARAAELDVAMEINSQPDRVDLSDANARRAHELGVTLVIDTDAHSIPNLDLIRYGVFAARRAGLTRDDVLNTVPYERLRGRIRKGGGRVAPAAAKAAARARSVARPKAAAKTAAKPKAAARLKPTARMAAAKTPATRTPAKKRPARTR
ncbi:MAG: DNA polymerase/3'-5' exonuclease PolX [Candidatus Eisenbacteria bacterium]|nr:DNA polymerase/3'-5' exonuclease PolX [Candidatus Eisenbacteria bacterium]